MSQVRPGFVDDISKANFFRRKNVVLVTGAISDQFFSPKAGDFISLEQTLNLELSPKFNLLRVDMSTGINFFDSVFGDSLSETEQGIKKVAESGPEKIPYEKVIRKNIEGNRHESLATLVLTKQITDLFGRAKRMGQSPKPICVVMQHAGYLFPSGSPGHLSEIDRQRLTFFLSWISDPLFIDSHELLILINKVKTEVSSEITALPNVAHVEIPLPDESQRRKLVEIFEKKDGKVQFEMGPDMFCSNTAGLSITSVRDMLEVAHLSEKPISHSNILVEVNDVLRARLGDIISIKHPAHRPKDIIGYEATGKIMSNIFRRCEDPETAISAILVSGPNGGGKTYQLEAYAAESGRVVIELTGLRSSLFGDTDRFFEQFRWNVVTLGKVLILVDEAHTAFGSVHSSDTHETEKRLAGNIIKLMGDPSLRGKVLWGLMTSRPDELDPDVKSRAPIQIPIFDLDGEDRKTFVRQLFNRKKVQVEEDELTVVLGKTGYYSNRDLDNLVREFLAQRKENEKISVVEVLGEWQASRSIEGKRRLQTFIAAQHCSYPKLLPPGLEDVEEIERKIESMKLGLR